MRTESCQTEQGGINKSIGYLMIEPPIPSIPEIYEPIKPIRKIVIINVISIVVSPIKEGNHRSVPYYLLTFFNPKFINTVFLGGLYKVMST